MTVKPNRANPVGVKPPHPILRGYGWLLNLALRHRPATIGIAFGFLAVVILLQVFFGRGIEFFPASDPDSAYVDLRLAPGTSLEETNALALEIERRLRKYKDIKFCVSSVGAQSSANPLRGGAGGNHLARISFDFVDSELRSAPSTALVKEIRRDLSDITGAEVEVKRQEMGPPTGAAVSVKVAGEKFEVLEELSETIKRRISSIRSIVDVRDDYEEARPEMRLAVDRSRAALLGLSTTIIANFVKTAFQGAKVGTYREGDDEYDITLRLPEQFRSHLSDVLRLYVPERTGSQVPLSSLAHMEYSSGPGFINRVDQERVITVEANVVDRPSSAVLADVRRELSKLPIPVGYSIRYAGEKEEQDKARNFLLKAFMAAVLMIVLVLVAEFDSIRTPLIIMTTVLLSLGGAFLGLLLTGKPFGIIMTGIGVICLAGVVVNNGILLLDCVERFRRDGLDLHSALVRAGAIRLRPVFLTAITTLLGLIPMATGLSFDFRAFSWQISSRSSQFWSPMAVAVIFGLGIATFLTLLVVPVLYSLAFSSRSNKSA